MANRQTSRPKALETDSDAAVSETPQAAVDPPVTEPAPRNEEPTPASEPLDGTELGSSKRRMPDNFRKYLLRVQGGKMYLPAAYRIVWFRDECPDWGVQTDLIEGGQSAGFATVQARITDPKGHIVASGIKTETQRDFPAGWVEKAETGAIARALAVAGFGTQFMPELDELTDEDRVRLSDSPQPSGRTEYSPHTRHGSRVAESAPRASAVEADQAGAANGTSGRPPAEVWGGPGLCPDCHAPEGKPHAARCKLRG